MKKVKIRNKNYSDPAINWDFQSPDPQPKIDELIASGIIGLPDRWLQDSPLSPLSEEEKEKATDTRVVNDGLGNGWTEYFFPAEYTIEIQDITAQIEAEQAQIQAIKNAQLQAGLRLQDFPEQVDACQDLDALKLAIKQMVQDIAVLLK